MHTQFVYYSFLSHCNKGCRNVPLCTLYVLCYLVMSLPLLLWQEAAHVRCCGSRFSTNFIGSYAPSQNYEKRLLFRHVCHSVRPNGTTRLPPDGFSWNLILPVFFENLSRKSTFIKIRQEQRLLYKMINIYFRSYLDQFISE